MEIILREDVEKTGFSCQVVKVTAGYARNFLLPIASRSRPPNPIRRSSSRSARRICAAKPSCRAKRRICPS